MGGCRPNADAPAAAPPCRGRPAPPTGRTGREKSDTSPPGRTSRGYGWAHTPSAAIADGPPHRRSHCVPARGGSRRAAAPGRRTRSAPAPPVPSAHRSSRRRRGRGEPPAPARQIPAVPAGSTPPAAHRPPEQNAPRRRRTRRRRDPYIEHHENRTKQT